MESDFHRRWWLTSPVHQGDHGGAVKTIAQGMPCDFGGPCECACVFSSIAREAAGASSIRHSLRPHHRRRENFLQNSGAWRRENDFCCLKSCINTLAVVPASAPRPTTTDVRVGRHWGGNPITMNSSGYGSLRSQGRRIAPTHTTLTPCRHKIARAKRISRGSNRREWRYPSGVRLFSPRRLVDIRAFHPKCAESLEKKP